MSALTSASQRGMHTTRSPSNIPHTQNDGLKMLKRQEVLVFQIKSIKMKRSQTGEEQEGVTGSPKTANPTQQRPRLVR